MGIFTKRQAQPLATKGELRGYRWNDTGITDALVRNSERLRRKYANDPVAKLLVDSCRGCAYTYARRNARLLSAQTLRLYRVGGRSGGADRGRSVGKHQRKSLVKRWGGKVADRADSGGELIEVTQHPLLDFKARPNPLYPGTELDEMKFLFKPIAGNYYNMLSQEKGGTYFAWPAYPQFMTIQHDDTDMVAGYFFGRDQTSVVELEPEDVIHYRNGLDKNNPLIGESDIAHVLGGIDLLQRVLEFDIAFAQNGNRPDFMLKVDVDANDVQVSALQKVVDTFWRSTRRGSAPWVSRGVEPFPLTTPAKDLRTVEQMAPIRKDIAAALGWTQSMVDSNDSTYAGAKVADGQYGQYISDKLNEDAAQETAFLVPLFGLDPDVYFFAYDDPIAEDEERQESRATSLVAGGILTINEARQELGYDKSDDENAEALLFNGQPLAQTPQSADPLSGLLAGFGQRSEAGGSENQSGGEQVDAPPAPQEGEAAGDETASAAKSLDLAKVALGAEALRWTDGDCQCCTKDDDDDYAGNPILNDIANRYLKPLFGTAQDIVTEAQGEAVRQAGAGQVPDLAAQRESAIAKLNEALRPLVEVSIEQALGVGSSVPDEAFDVVPERAVAFLDDYTPQLADDIMDTTSEMARVAVQRGLEEGLTVDEVAIAIEGVPAYRAERIARTELSNASHAGMIEGWKEAGVEMGKWVTAPGPSAAHAMIASRDQRPLGDVWVKAGETLGKETFDRDVTHPPARPNCRCSLQPVLEDL